MKVVSSCAALTQFNWQCVVVNSASAEDTDGPSIWNDNGVEKNGRQSNMRICNHL